MKMNNPKTIYFWWSASEVYSAKFVKWVITRMHTGSEDTNKLGVGAIIESDWLFSRALSKRIPYGCKRGQHILRPYMDLYRSNKSAWKRRNKIKRPTLEQLRSLE